MAEVIYPTLGMIVSLLDNASLRRPGDTSPSMSSPRGGHPLNVKDIFKLQIE